jgi:hypothetical protein
MHFKTYRRQPPLLGIATASPTLPLALEGLACFEYDEASASERDLALLTLVTRVARLVVTVQEQHDLPPVGVAEDTKQDLLTLGCLAARRRAGEHVLDLGRRVADAELEEPFPELLAPLCPTDVDPAMTQHVLEAGHECGQLKVSQVGIHPLFDWTPGVIVLEELDGELAGAHRRDHSRGNDRTRRRGGRRTSFPFAPL